MEALSLFVFKSIIVSGLLTAWYLLGLRGRRLHQYNRFFLLSILFVSLIVPFLHLNLFSIPVAGTGGLAPVARLLQDGSAAVVNTSGIQSPVQSEPGWRTMTCVIIAGISLLLLMILIFRVLTVLRMRRQNDVLRLDGVNVILTDSPKAPFTFLTYVFWSKSIPLQDEIGQLIFRHELAHIEQGHTYDKLLCQALTCIFWFNPFYWIIQKELNIVHEFVADECAVGNKNTEAFALMLLRSYSRGSYLVPEHHFFSSTIKRRLSMLQNSSKPTHAGLRKFLAIPLTVGAILLFSFGCRTGMNADTAPAKKTIVVLLDAAHGGLDVGAHSNGFVEKDICLKYAKRIKELAPAYNIDVRLTRADDRYMVLSQRVGLSEKIKPDVFISLHVGDEPGKDKEKGDFDIYISGQNDKATPSRDYSNGIFEAMTQDAIIPGVSKATSHVHSKGCTCDSCKTLASVNTGVSATEAESFYVLKNSTVPSMVVVLGNIKNDEGMRQLTDNNRLDLLCNAILKGIVQGAAEKDAVTISNSNILYGDPAESKCR